MPSCVVKWCRSHTNRKNTGITFHKFPSNLVQREKWVAAVRLERNECNWMPAKQSPICSIHFQDEDIYTLDNGKRKLLRKFAVPICTMVTRLCANVRPSALGDLSGPSSITNDIKIQEESSIPPRDLKDEASLEQNTKKQKLHVSDCSCMPGKKIKIEQYFKQEKHVNLEHVSSNTHESILKRILEQPGCSYVEKKRCKMMECPSCKYKFYILTKILDSGASLPASIEMQSQCSTPISVHSSEIESAFNTPRKQVLQKQLTLKTALAKKRLIKIKKLQQQNKRLKNKNLGLKYIITKYLKNN